MLYNLLATLLIVNAERNGNGKQKQKNAGTKLGMIVTPGICRGIFCKKLLFSVNIARGCNFDCHKFIVGNKLIFKKIGKDCNKL